MVKFKDSSINNQIIINLMVFDVLIEASCRFISFQFDLDLDFTLAN